VIHHVTLEVADAEAEVAFWAVLGFTEVQPPEGIADRARWLEHGGTQIHVMPVDAPVVPAHGHVAVVAEDYDAVREALLHAGVEVLDRTPYWGAARLFARSPGGHRVEVMAYGPTRRP
jgi:catechol 2,3-dioxygenase-like lactoylglutathione lyase family enzyme